MHAFHAGTLKAVTVSFSSTRQKETPGAWRYVLSRSLSLSLSRARALSLALSLALARALERFLFHGSKGVSNVVQLGIESWQNAYTGTHS